MEVKRSSSDCKASRSGRKLRATTSSMEQQLAIKRLRELEQESKTLRKTLGISRPDEVIFQASQDDWSDDEVIVEADGFGGATLLIVEGNYPIDYLVKSRREFTSEEQACEAATQLTGF